MRGIDVAETNKISIIKGMEKDEKIEEKTVDKVEEAPAEKPSKKKKLPLAVKILLFPFEFALILAVIVLLWFTWCYFDRIKPVEALPPDYALYLRTDSVWDAAEPLLDLDATLIAMTSPELQKYRESYLEVKKSKYRKNIFLRNLLHRRVDAALYGFDEEGKASALAIVDAGFYSGALRFAPYIIPKIKKLSGKMEISTNRHGSFYQMENGYFIIKKNLVVFSTNRELLEEAMTFGNSGLYKSNELEAVNARLKEPMRILANGQNLLRLGQSSELVKNYLEVIVPYLSEEEYTSINLGITNNELNLTLSVPLELEDDAEEEHPVLKLLKKDSVVPSLLPKFSDEVQYYTLFSAGTLQELKDAAAKMLPPEKDFDATWSKSDTLCKIVFNTSLDDLLFSWSADELAVFGIEGKEEPVFAIKIADEAQRRRIFDRIFASYIVQSNDSLLVNGVRLPCIQMPAFLLSILKILNINVPKPYYLIKDDYIYFSQSPENLAAINSEVEKARKLSGSENWTRVSSKQSPYSTLSLYYNLERSVPFFIKGNSAMSKILALYNSGRFDLKIKDNTLTVQLQASAAELESSLYIPGFPLELENKSDAVLVKSKAKKSSQLFWLEKDSTINSLDLGSFARGKLELPGLQYLCAASEACVKENGGEVWALTKSGMVYLLNGKLEVLSGYPILTGAATDCPPFVYKDSLVIACTDGTFTFVSPKGEISSFETGVEGGLKATPEVKDDIIAFYEKGFFGGIHIYKGAGSGLEPVTAQGPLELEGIAYGSPCLFSAGGKDYVAMITQAGELYVYDFDGKLLAPFPLYLDGVFYLNVKMADGYLFALSADGMLYRVGLDGNTLMLKLPYFTAKSGLLSVYDYDEKGGQEIFITGEGNSLYGFNSQLELLPEFPVPGYGNPVFEDLNGDNLKDCLVITFDNKLSAVEVLK